MTFEQFAYWLQGFMEIADPVELSPEEVQKIKDHLALVFQKLTPVYNGGLTITPMPNPIVPGSYGPPPGQIYIGDPPGIGGLTSGGIRWQEPRPVTYCSHGNQGNIEPNQLVVSC